MSFFYRLYLLTGYGFVTYGNYQSAYNSVTALSNYQIAPNRYLSVEFKKYA